MASVLTDQVLRAKNMAPVVALVAATPKTVQFSTVTPFGQTGNATVVVPGTGRVTGNPFRVRVQGSLTQVVSAVCTLTLALNGTAIATLVTTAATGTNSFSLSVDALFEAATVALSGVQSGWFAATPKVVTSITAFTGDLTTEGNVLTVAISDASTDAGAVLTLSEFSVEVL